MLSNRRVERSGGAKWKAKRACRVLRVLGCRVEGFQRPVFLVRTLLVRAATQFDPTREPLARFTPQKAPQLEPG